MTISRYSRDNSKVQHLASHLFVERFSGDLRMSQPLPPMIEPLPYADSTLTPQRPGILIAVGVISLVLCLVVPLVNLLGIVGAARLYALHNPPPPAPLGPPPLQPATPPVPFTGDYLPTGGLPVDQRTNVLDAVNKQVAMSEDRRAMFDRLLAECGGGPFANLNNALISMQVQQNQSGPDGPGLGTHVVSIPAGRFQIDNGDATFTPADGSPNISIHGNIVNRPGFTGFTAGMIDELINDLQRRSNNPLNALQAGALADEIRTTALWTSSPRWDYPVVEPINSPGQGTISLSLEVPGSAGREQWILSNGYLIPDTSRGPYDPATGILVRNLPPAPFPGQIRQRPALPLDSWIINGSFIEYGLSIMLVPLLLIAGIRLLMDKPDGAWLHGIYVLIKPWLAIANCYLGIWTILELSDAHFYTANAETIAYVIVIVGLFLQLSYPIALIAVFSSIPVRRYEFKRGNAIGPAGGLFPQPMVAAAAAFAPDRWGRIVASAMIALSIAVLTAQLLRLTSLAGDFYVRSWMTTPFIAPCVLATIILIAGVARTIKGGRA
jgi:hypothetical protein